MDDNKRKQIRTLVQSKAPETNMLVAKILIIFSAICFLMWLVFEFGILKSKGNIVLVTLIGIPLLFVTVSVLCLIKKGKGKYFQYIFIILLAIFWFELEVMSGYKSRLLLPVFLLISLKYYNKNFTVFTFIVSEIVLLATVFCNAYIYADTGFIDLNTVRLDTTYAIKIQGFLYNNIIMLKPDSGMLLKNGLQLIFFPNTIFLSILFVIALRFMKQNLFNLLAVEDLASSEAEHKLALANLKTKVMLSQVKPHFIYNTLTSIAYLCMTDPQKAKKLTIDFSSFLRNNLDTLNDTGITFCSFESELDHIKSYLNIELVRFEDLLTVEYDTQDTMFSVPVLSIQPIVENAVKHGISKKVGGGTLKISTYEVENGHHIVIEDDGIGFDPTVPPNDGKEHIGIENIKNRLSMMGGTVSFESAVGKGTKVTVFIPNEVGLAS